MISPSFRPVCKNKESAREFARILSCTDRVGRVMVCGKRMQGPRYIEEQASRLQLERRMIR